MTRDVRRLVEITITIFEVGHDSRLPKQPQTTGLTEGTPRSPRGLAQNAPRCHLSQGVLAVVVSSIPVASVTPLNICTLQRYQPRKNSKSDYPNIFQKLLIPVDLLEDLPGKARCHATRRGAEEFVRYSQPWEKWYGRPRKSRNRQPRLNSKPAWEPKEDNDCYVFDLSPNRSGSKSIKIPASFIEGGQA
jgi:hypothetical protein